MSQITYVSDKDELTGVIIETVLIDHGNGNFTSMLKSAYDEMLKQAEQSTPIPTGLLDSQGNNVYALGYGHTYTYGADSRTVTQSL